MLPLLDIRDLSVDFLSEGQKTTAVNNVSVSLHRNEILALVGESGSGKSVTSLSILNLLPQPPAVYASGRILFSPDGATQADLLQADEKEIRRIRGNGIGMIFQEPMSSLNPVMRCGRQVSEAIRVHKKLSAEQAKEQTVEWFRKVRLPDASDMYHRYPHELSGGQKQRVMIAMAMCCNPSLLICDEPTTALDVTVQKTILDLIRELQQEHHMGVIFITHDLGVVKEIADRVAIMYRGSIVELNTAAGIFSEARHPYTKALIACRPALHPRGEKLPVVSDFMERKTTVATPLPAVTRGSSKTLVQVENLVVRFPGKKNFFGRPQTFFTAVNGVSFTINEGETVGLVGESGCGKTTLGRALLQLVMPASGRILYKGRDMTEPDEKQLSQLRKEVQLVFQDPYSSLNPRLTIGTAIAEPMKMTGIEKTAERRKKVAELLDRVNLAPSMMDRYPHEFSGGQRQRIVIARALAPDPGFLVCDESVSALDVSVQAQVLNLLNELKNELGLTMLFISHDLSVVRYMSDRIMVMHQGTIVESGPADEVYNRPKHNYTRELIGAVPNL